VPLGQRDLIMIGIKENLRHWMILLTTNY
jgi:hypothetical protein